FGLAEQSLDTVSLSSRSGTGRRTVFSCNSTRGSKVCFLGEGSSTAAAKDGIAAAPPSWWGADTAGVGRPPDGSLACGLEAADALAQVLHKRPPFAAYECFMQGSRVAVSSKRSSARHKSSRESPSQDAPKCT
ncbi:unnamed protein product, partial [Polarella glacialis]